MSEGTRLRALDVSFPGVGPVLRGVDLDLPPGRCLAVVGESGAGKSVLARSLIGLASEGGSRARIATEELTVAGRDMRGASPRQWRELRGQRVGLVLQDALQSLDPLRRIADEVAEPLAVRRPRIPRTQRNARAVAALTHAELPDAELHLRSRSGELSGGMRQRALIASAIISHPPLIIADEPTTALDSTVAAGVLDLLGRLRDEGAAVLLITHDLTAARRIADDVMVLDDGEVVESGPFTATFASPTHPKTRALIAAVPRGPREGAPASVSGAEAGPILSATGLHRHYRLPDGTSVPALDGVDVTISAGQVLGVVGESGSGKTTLARVLLGMENPDSGHVDSRARMRLVPQDPLGSFDPRFTAGRILHHAIAAAGSSHTPAGLLTRVRLPESVAGRYPRALSGGQRQRLAIARALAADPQLLILDEPTSALDATVQKAILDLLLDIQTRLGMAMMFISHDLAVVRRMSHRVAVMESGRIVEAGPTESVWTRPTQPLTKSLLSAL